MRPRASRGRPKNEQLSTRRKEEILDVAARVFAARGFPNTDVQTVADELGIGKGTIYRYFPAKKELFLAAVDRGMRRLTAHIDASMTSEDPSNLFEQVLRAYLSFFKENPELVELLIQERAEFRDRPRPTYFAHRDANVEKYHALVRRLIADGRIRQLPVETITDVMGDLMYGTMFTDYFSGRQRSPEEQAAAILEVVMGGLLTETERSKKRTGEGRDGQASPSALMPRGQSSDSER